MTDIRVTEEFDNPQGEYTNYDVQDPILQEALEGRKHVNIRSFISDSDQVALNMFQLDQLNQMTLDSYTMADLETTTIISGESWSATGEMGFTTVKQGNYWHRAIQTNMTTGTVVLTSVGAPLDLDTGFTDDDFISMSFPDLPLHDLSMEDSSLVFGQGSDTVILTWDTSIVDPVDNEYSELRWPRSALNDLLHPDTITINITATASCNVFISSLRLISQTWTPTVLDMDTNLKRLETAPNLDGTSPSTLFPALWRSDDPPGDADPRPYNATITVNFGAGDPNMDGDLSFPPEAVNSIELRFRGRTEDDMTMQTLDTMTMADLDALDSQPDFGTNNFQPKTQSILDTYVMDDLDNLTMSDLERLPQISHGSWISVRLVWSKDTGTHVQIGKAAHDVNGVDDSDLVIYDIDLGDILDIGEYLWSVQLVDSTMRIQLFVLDSIGGIASTYYDSGTITDTDVFKYTKGRLGWTFDLQGPGTYVNGVRTSDLMYGEFITQAFESITPVDGAQLYVSASPNKQLYLGAEPFNSSQLNLDTSFTHSDDGSIKVTTSSAYQGIQSNDIEFTNFANTEIKFDLYFPQVAINAGADVVVLLQNSQGDLIQLTTETIVGDEWKTYTVSLAEAFNQQTGIYKFLIMQTKNYPTSWWLDNISVEQRVISWSARAALQDPWGQHKVAWVDFGDTINSSTDGVLFGERGRHLQVRAQAHSQDATIQKMSTIPKYSQLGRFAWQTDEKITDIPTALPQFEVIMDLSPIADVDVDGISYLSYAAPTTFTASVKDSDDDYSYLWDFGDGDSAVGNGITHQYKNINATIFVHVTAVSHSTGKSYRASRLFKLSPYVELITNGDFETSTAGWSVSNAFDGITTTWASTGTHSLEIGRFASAADYRLSVLQTDTNWGHGPSTILDVSGVTGYFAGSSSTLAGTYSLKFSTNQIAVGQWVTSIRFSFDHGAPSGNPPLTFSIVDAAANVLATKTVSTGHGTSGGDPIYVRDTIEYLPSGPISRSGFNTLDPRFQVTNTASAGQANTKNWTVNYTIVTYIGTPIVIAPAFAVTAGKQYRARADFNNDGTNWTMQVAWFNSSSAQISTNTLMTSSATEIIHTDELVTAPAGAVQAIISYLSPDFNRTTASMIDDVRFGEWD